MAKRCAVGEVWVDQIEDLKARSRKEQQSLFDKFSARITHVESLRPAFGFVALGGALILGISRLLPDPWGTGVAILGGVTAAAGGAFVVMLDFKKLEISQDAKDAHRTADEAIAALAVKQSELDGERDALSRAAKLDRKRLARIEATRLMIESLEAALLRNADARLAARQLLTNSSASLRNAVDYQTSDFLTFTIFRKTRAGRGEIMRPIAREWTDAPEATTLGRHWKRGEGYTGHVWSLAQDNREASVVEPDTQRPEAQKYMVKTADAKHEARYRSVASFPILVGKDNDIWGVVTATSDRAGVFDHQGDLARQGVETVRDIAMIASLLTKLKA